MGLFSKKILKINLEKNEYNPGESIKGVVKLELDEPLKGKKLEVALIGAVIKTEQGHSYHHSDDKYSFDNDNSFETATPFYFSKIILDERKEYNTYEYPFEIKIPYDVHKDEPKFDGTLGKLMKFSKKFGGKPPYIQWYVKTQLDVPMKIDLRAAENIKLN